MKFHASDVSTCVAGDYYQAMFELQRDADSADSPYLLIQRQFEMPDAGRCCIETPDKNYIGHFRLRRLEFSSSRILVEISRPKNNQIEVTFAITPIEFEQASEVIATIRGSSNGPCFGKTKHRGTSGDADQRIKAGRSQEAGVIKCNI
ncbi:MAG: hypothetical protein EXR28_06515 [Betaproteobacteria bacterium]|nr:hypothetical protein [Betaproteobacteria bacterium]